MRDPHEVANAKAAAERERQERSYYRDKLAQAIARIPQWLVNGGSIQVVAQYKQAVMQAQKTMKKVTASSSDLSNALTQVQQFDKPEGA